MDIASGLSWKEYVDRLLLDHQHAVEAALAQNSSLQVAQQRTLDITLDLLEKRIEATQSLVRDRVEDVRREASAALASSEKAISKSESASERRFDAVNEFREQLSDQARTFMPREVAEAKIDDIRRNSDARVEDLRKQMSRIQTRIDEAAGASVGATRTIGYMIGIAGTLLTIFIFVAAQLHK